MTRKPRSRSDGARRLQKRIADLEAELREKLAAMTSQRDQWKRMYEEIVNVPKWRDSARRKNKPNS